MRIQITEKASVTELYAPDSLAGLVFALKDRFDQIESGHISILVDRRVSAAILRSPLETDSEPLLPGKKTKD